MENDYFDAWDEVRTPKDMITIIAHDVRMFSALALGVIQALRGEMAETQIPLPILALEKLAQTINEQVNNLLSLREIPESYANLSRDDHLSSMRVFLKEIADIHTTTSKALQDAREAIADYEKLPKPQLEQYSDAIVSSLDMRAIKTKQYIDVTLIKLLPLKLQT